MNHLIQYIFIEFILSRPSEFTKRLMDLRGSNQFFRAEIDRTGVHLCKKRIINNNYDAISFICLANQITKDLPADISHYLSLTYVKLMIPQHEIDKIAIICENKTIYGLKSLYDQLMYDGIKCCEVCSNINIVKDDSYYNGLNAVQYPLYCLYGCNARCVECKCIRHISITEYIIGVDYYRDEEIYYFGYSFNCKNCSAENERNMARIRDSDFVIAPNK